MWPINQDRMLLSRVISIYELLNKKEYKTTEKRFSSYVYGAEDKVSIENQSIFPCCIISYLGRKERQLALKRQSLCRIKFLCFIMLMVLPFPESSHLPNSNNFTMNMMYWYRHRYQHRRTIHKCTHAMQTIFTTSSLNSSNLDM